MSLPFARSSGLRRAEQRNALGVPPAGHRRRDRQRDEGHEDLWSPAVGGQAQCGGYQAIPPALRRGRPKDRSDS